MKLRIALVALGLLLVHLAASFVLLGPLLELLPHAAATQPAGPQLDKWRATFWLLSLLTGVVLSGVAFLLMLRLFGAPMAKAQGTLERIAASYAGIDTTNGGLFNRLDVSLRRLSEALGEERERNRSQLASLSASNEQLLRLQTELVAADRLATVGKLASGVAHEVGNPLSGILGYLSVIRMRAKGDAELLELVDRIEAEVQRIDQIVRALLELGRPSRGKAQPVDVRPVLDSCVKLLAAGRDFRGVSVDVDAPTSFWLRAEPGPLSQVLVNLLINAAQAMDGQGRIVVRLTEDAAAGHIAVEDEGPGLPPGVLEHLFEPFFTTRPAGKGTGLGLAVSQHLLSQFEGALVAENRVGHGARFTITLPKP